MSLKEDGDMEKINKKKKMMMMMKKMMMTRKETINFASPVHGFRPLHDLRPGRGRRHSAHGSLRVRERPDERRRPWPWGAKLGDPTHWTSSGTDMWNTDAEGVVRSPRDVSGILFLDRFESGFAEICVMILWNLAERRIQSIQREQWLSIRFTCDC